jgi:hypothetical protein
VKLLGPLAPWRLI